MLRLGGMGARREMQAEDGDFIYGVEQKLPLFGKPQLARKVAQAELATEEAGLDYQFQSIAAISRRNSHPMCSCASRWPALKS